MTAIIAGTPLSHRYASALFASSNGVGGGVVFDDGTAGGRGKAGGRGRAGKGRATGGKGKDVVAVGGIGGEVGGGAGGGGRRMKRMEIDDLLRGECRILLAWI
jgi:hypothetical protein